jgi:hypothetical protein
VENTTSHKNNTSFDRSCCPMKTRMSGFRGVPRIVISATGRKGNTRGFAYSTKKSFILHFIAHRKFLVTARVSAHCCLEMPKNKGEEKGAEI